ISIDNGVTFQPIQSFTGLESGTYEIVIRDANDCELDTTVLVTALPSVTFDFTFIEPLCFGDNTGVITFTQVDGGTSPYVFSIDGGLTTQVGQTFEFLEAGNYSLTVIDANGCNADLMPAQLNSPNSITADISTTDLQCNNDATGAIVIDNLQGGSGNFQFSIDGGTTFSNNTTFSNLQAGSYTVQIRDENDCVLNETLTITEPQPINASINSQDALCFGEASGQIIVNNLSGGTAPLTFSLDGQNFQASATFSQLSAGNYTVTIQDANGCTIQQNVTVLSPSPLSLSSELNGVTCFGDCDATINVSAAGGVSPYVFAWQDSQVLSAFRSDLCAGSYTILVTDINGCEISETFNIEEPEELTADFLLPNEKITVINTNINFFNQSSGAIFYNWNFNGIGISTETNPSFNFPEEPGEYFVTLVAIGEGGCTDTITRTIIIEDEVIFYVPNTFTPNGNQLNEVFTPVFTSGFDPFDFQMLIFNRWGEVVFETFNAAVGWNGLYGDKPAPDGVYIWKITFQELNSDVRRSLTGHVNLLR
ncbi:MAG: gliding motility-associated C-terminal domain-containing protein, partial [Crocinitomicaceae bacterium]|nr:gliding motility-associated C-terminal domain-containing protein [Crocinitomicaceae bacterium]